MPNDAGPTIAPAGHGPAPVAVAALAAGLLVAQQVAAKVVRDAFFLSQFPVSALPLAVAAGAVLSLLAVAALSRGMARVPPARLLPAMLWSSAVLLVSEWALSLVAPRAAAAAVYLHVALFGAAVVSSFWAMVNERFDPHTARHAMGRIGSGASVGGVLGAAATWRLSTLVPVSALLLAIAALVAVGAMVTRRLGRERTEPARPDEGASTMDAAEARAGWRVLAAMPYLRSLAGLVALCALMEALLDYAFSAAAVGRFGRGQGLVSFFAAFHTTTGVLALVVQAALVRWLLARVGLAGTLTVHSLGVAALAAVTAAVPRMGALVVLRAAEAVLRHSTFRSAYELFYTPLPPHRKRPAKPLVDVGADRVGTLAGSIATAAVVALAGRHTSSVLVLMALAAALGMMALAWRLHRGYVTALGDSLRAGVVRVEASEVVDATTLHTVQDFRPVRPAVAEPAVAPPAPPLDKDRAREDDLRSGDAARIRAVLSEAVLDPGLVALATPLLARDDLFGEIVLAFRRAAPRCTGQLIDVLLDPATPPVVRRRIPRVLASVPTQRAADGLLAGLECDRLDVRYRSAQALVRLRQRATVRMPSDVLFALAAREIEGLAAGGGARLDHVFALLSLALGGEPMAMALRALRGTDASLRGTALEYLDHVLPAAIRTALWPRLGTTAVQTASRRTVDEVRGELLASSWHATVGERRSRNSRAG